MEIQKIKKKNINLKFQLKRKNKIQLNNVHYTGKIIINQINASLSKLMLQILY